MSSIAAHANGREISVALTTCNGARYLPAQLESILEQSLLPLELVVGDDASTDSTLEILENFAARAPFPVVILRNNPRKGVLENFCYVFEHCQGNYIAYCDQDDVWHKDKLSICRDALIKHRASSVSHMSEIVDDELSPTGQLMPTGFSPGVYKAPSFPHRYWRVGHELVFSRELLAPINKLRSTARQSLRPCTNNLDLLITLVGGMWGTTVFLPDALVKFRRHEQTVSACGKEEPDSGGTDKYREKRKKLARWLTLAQGLQAYLLEDDKDDALGLGVERKSRYLAYLDKLTSSLSSRITVYKGETFLKRATGLVAALRHGAYDSQFRGGGGLKQAAFDAVVLATSLQRSSNGHRPK